MTEAEWDQMLVAVNVMKIGFVAAPIGWLDHLAGVLSPSGFDNEREGRR